MNIAVIGMGYVGLVTAIYLAEKGNSVIGMDVDKSKIEMLKHGKSPFYEPMIEEMMHKNNKKLKYTLISDKKYNNIDVFFIAVGTPQKEDGSTNMKYVYNAINKIVKNITKDITIVIKSTVPVGTHYKLKEMLNNNSNNYKINIVSNPEFLSQGTAIQDVLNPQRIIIGTDSNKTVKLIKKIYQYNNKKYVITDPYTAELIKYACNSFLALKISYINDIANMCEYLHANIEDIQKAMSLDKRIGKYFLNPGLGYGGSCFPKDTKELSILANIYKYDFKTVNSAIQVNERQKFILLDKARKYYKSFNNLNVAILGISFKPNTDDLREAQSIDNILKLRNEGANIKIYDPIAEHNAKKIIKNKAHFCKTIDETLNNSDICFIFTEWDFIKQMDINHFSKKMKNPIVIDGRNCFKLKDVKKHNIIYESIGRPIINKINNKTQHI